MSRRFALPLLAIVVALALFALSTHATRADPRNFTLINGSSVTITHLYVGPSSSDDWGDDILGVDTLTPGESANILFSRYDGDAGNCIYDIKVIGKEDTVGYLYQVNLCETLTVTFVDAS